eukprot:9062000-Pyramimonas_sp.AAC.1
MRHPAKVGLARTGQCACRPAPRSAPALHPGFRGPAVIHAVSVLLAGVERGDPRSEHYVRWCRPR